MPKTKYLTMEQLEYFWHKVKNWGNLKFAKTEHSHSTASTTSLGSYAKAASPSDLTSSDSLNQALGKLEAKADNAVHKTGNESVSGTKTFATAPVVKASNIDKTGTTSTNENENTVLWCKDNKDANFWQINAKRQDSDGINELRLRSFNAGGKWADFRLRLEDNNTYKAYMAGSSGTTSGGFDGNASSATKLQTARKLKTKLSSTSDALFDGSADQVNIPVDGILGIANGGTGLSSLDTFVRTTGDQTISGTKTFSSPIDASITGTAARATNDANGNSISATYATKSSAALTGSPTAPTPSSGDNSTRIATTAFVQDTVSDIMNSASETLAALNELSASLQDDQNLAASLSSQIGGKLDASSPNYVKGLSISGQTITVTKGDNTTQTLTTQDNDTHWTTKAIVGASNGTANAAQSDPYIRIFDENTARASIRLVGSGATSISSDANGTITINAADTVYTSMTGATASANGTSGLVPQPTAGNQGKYLRGDGTWQTPTNTTYTAASQAPLANGTATVGTSAKYAREDHVHPMQEKIQAVPVGTTFVTGATEGNALVNSKATSYGAVFNAPTKNNRVSLSTYPGNNDLVYLSSITNENIANGTNTTNKSVTWNAADGTLTATKFSGPLTGNVTGNVSGSSGSCTGNAATATKLATARDINVSDADGTNTGTKISFDGSGNGTIKLPATIKANITGNVSGSSGSCTGNAATATKATQDGSGNVITSTYVNLTGAQTISGAKTFSSNIVFSGCGLTNPTCIEFKPSASTSNNGGYLDFHYNQSTSDYTSRIIESASGTLSINGVTVTSGKVVTATTFTGALSGNASTATKLATARDINISDADGTNTGTKISFDGSAGGTIKLPATIKASITGNCSGSSGSCTGNAATATKLASAQSVTLTGAITGTASSQAGWSVGTVWRSCMVGQSGSTNTNPWYKVATFAVANANDDISATFLVDDTYSSHKQGILKVHVRTDGSKVVSTSATELTWLTHTGFAVGDFVLVCPTGATPTVELWTKIATGYMYRRFTVLSEGSRSATSIRWTLLNASSAGQAESITTTGTQIASKLAGQVASAASSSGNAATATSAGKLTTARTINGTSFDGSANITTANWGTARNVSISDSDATNTGSAVSVNGSAAVTLKLPATIKASITGNCSGSSGSCTGNAATATKLATARDINISDADGTNTGTKISFDGSANGTIKLPSTIKASITGNCSGSSGSCTGNAATATKLATARTINGVSFDGSANITVADSTKVAKAGDTMTGSLKISKNNNAIGTGLVLTGATQNYGLEIQATNLTKGTVPSANIQSEIAFYGSVMSKWQNRVSCIQSKVDTNNTSSMSIIAYNATSAENTGSSSIGAAVNSSGTAYTWAPNPAKYDNSTKIATTNYVVENAARHSSGNITIYVSNEGTGAGGSAAAAMGIQDMWRYLACLRMQPAAGNSDNSRTLTILFVPTSTSYGTVTFDASKIPGVRNIVVNTSTGTNSTTSNYSTNSPTFANFYVNGSGLQVTLRNIEVTGTVCAEWHGRLTCDTYVGAARFLAHNWGRMDIGNGTYNIHNAGTDKLFGAYEYGQMILNTATMTVNFRELCYFNNAIFHVDSSGRLYLNYGRLKFTGTKPVVALAASGTKTCTVATAAGTAAKVGTLESGQTFTLAANAVAYVTFDNTNTAANPTLNINGTGAKAIWFNGAAIPASYLNKHIQYKFTYDGTHYVCNNGFQRVEVASYHTLFQYGSNYNTTYNSGSWNWDGFSRWWGNGASVNGVMQGGISGNSATATKLATARSINIQDSSATNTGTAASFDGSANATIKLPATIKANITGNCSGSSGSCTGNAATATKATQDGNGKVIASTYLPLAGGTVTGTLILSRTTDLDPTADKAPALIVGGTRTTAHIEIDNNEISAKANGTTEAGLYLHGSEVCAITPAASDSSTKIATTAWVKARLSNTEFSMVPSGDPAGKTVGTQYTAGTNGFFKVEHNNNIGNSDVVVTINGHVTNMHCGQYGSGGQHSGGCCFFPVKKGWTYKCTKANWCGFQAC